MNDLKLREINDSDSRFLFELLKKRDLKANLSHKEMPSYKQHIKFIKSKPYQKWYIIEKNRKKLGTIYFSKQNEIGVHFLPEIQSELIMQRVIQELIRKNPKEKYFLNVNPKNSSLIKFLEKNAFSLFQYTFEYNLIEPATRFINTNKASRFLDPDYSFELVDKKHTKHIIKWRNDPEIKSQFIRQEKLTEKRQEEFLKNYRALNRIDFILVDKQTREPLGSFHFTNLSSGIPEIGKLIGNKELRGKGIAYKSTRALLSFVFEELKLDKVYAKTKQNNIPNISLNQKLGFTVSHKEEIFGEIFIVMELLSTNYFKREDTARQIINVLITGTGGAGSLGREIMKSLIHSKNNYNIFATNSSALSVALFETKNSFIVPDASTPEYIEKMVSICKTNKIDVVIGGSEPEIQVLADNLPIFKENNILVLSNPSNVIKLCSDKLDAINYLNSKSIKCPKTYDFDPKLIDENDIFPIIIKPRKGSGSRNVFLCHDKEEAVFFGNYLKKYGHKPICQEHIGSSSEEYTIGILYADQGKLSVSVAMKRTFEGSLSTSQVTTSPRSGKKFIVSSGISQGYFDSFPELCSFGEKIAKTIGADGPINVQCRKDEKGQILAFEINPRFSGSVASRSMIGHNEPDILIQYKLNHIIPEISNSIPGYVMKDFNEKFISPSDVEKKSKHD